MSVTTTNFDAARQFAEMGLEKKRQGKRESASGPGSSRLAARPTLKLLRRTLRSFEIGSILDLGCGDWNWMQQLDVQNAGAGRKITYEGWDASPEMIESLTDQFGRPGEITFKLADILTTPLPQVDLIIIRDVLFHLPLSQSVPLMERIAQSCRYLVSTSFLGQAQNDDIAAYIPIDGWGFHRINLNVAPFNLAETMWEAVREPLCSNKGVARFVCLYDFGDPSER